MGLCAWVARKFDDAKEWAKEKKDNIKDKVSNVYAGFTGKKKYEEAKELYERITNRYNKKRKEFEDELDRTVSLIEMHVDSINKSKSKIKNNLFPEMAAKMSEITDISINKDFSIEEYKKTVLSFDKIRSKNELFKIDFDKNKFKVNVQAILTFGFYTRKKAKESLYAVQEEEKKVNHEIAKMEAELVKIKAINTSLENVDSYFVTLIDIYEKLLVRLDASVNYLYVRCISFARKLVGKEMSIRRLPKIQQQEVQAIITASKILKGMTDESIIAIENQKEVENYENNMYVQHNKIQNTYATI